MNNELVKIPACTIKLLRMDEEGHMWFECKEPIVCVQDGEHSFPARLHFYRKGFNYYVDVSGSAAVILNEPINNEHHNGAILLKLDVNNIEYAEPQTRQKTWLNQLVEKTQNWISNHIFLPGNPKPFLTRLQHNR